MVYSKIKLKVCTSALIAWHYYLMIITENFVYIHMPKTGGTFVTSVLFHLHNENRFNFTYKNFVYRFLGSILRRLQTSHRESGFYGPILDIEPKHGTCHNIPAEYRARPILSSVRNPLDWYVSQYEFGWWTRTFEYLPEAYPTPVGAAIEKALPAFQKTHPHFPKISFDEFLHLCSLAAAIFNETYKTNFGLYTHSFVQFYCCNIGKALSHLESLCSEQSCNFLEEFNEEIFDNTYFLKTHTINHDLYNFLVSVGYDEEHLDFLPSLKKILPMGRGRQGDQIWEKYYSPELKNYILTIDFPIFEIFPDFKQGIITIQ